MTLLAIHDIRKAYFDLNLDPYQLTFDDGLYSQYYYFPLFKNHSEKLTFFITTSFIKPGSIRPMFAGRDLTYIKSPEYMHRAFVQGRFDHFMNVEELQEICRQPNVQIGAHSHFHDVILTRTHAHKRKAVSRWKIERTKAVKGISLEEFSVRSKLAFQGYLIEGEDVIPRTEAAWEDYIKTDTECCLQWFEKNCKV